MNSRQALVVCALVGGLTTWGCSSDGDDGGSSGGGDFSSAMDAIALDFAQLLADVAPDPNALAVKQGNVGVCPGGGSGTWVGDAFSLGTLALEDCNINGIVINGSLTGLLDRFETEVVGNMLSGPVSFSGGASGDFNITNMIVSASLPIADETTFYEVRATTSSGQSICAWSGPGECMGFDGGGGNGETYTRTGGSCDPSAEFNDCELACFDLCGDDVAQFVECQDNGVCGCTCVNYGL
mgnify:CR=1 FL=1|jgi:hypothetical protein